MGCSLIHDTGRAFGAYLDGEVTSFSVVLGLLVAATAVGIIHLVGRALTRRTHCRTGPVPAGGYERSPYARRSILR